MNDKIIFAGFLKRFCAFAIDYAIISLLYAFLYLIIFLAPVLAIILWPFLIILFSVYFIFFNMNTPGIKIAGLAVVNKNMEIIGKGQSGVRLFLQLLSYTFFFLGHLVFFVNSKKRCLHDFASGSYVIEAGEPKSYFKVAAIVSVLLPIVYGVVITIILVFMALFVEQPSYDTEQLGEISSSTFQELFEDSDNVKNLGNKAKIISNNDIPVFENIFDLDISAYKNKVNGVQYNCKIKLSSNAPLLEHAPTPKVIYSSIFDSKNINILNKKAVSEMEARSPQFFLHDPNKVMETSQKIGLTEGKNCRDAYKLQGIAQISVVRTLYVAEMSVENDLGIPYSLGNGHNIILTKSNDFQNNISYKLHHNIGRKINVKLYDKNNKKLTKSSSNFITIDGFTTETVSPEGDANKIAIEIPIKIESKNVPFTIYTKPKKPTASKEELDNFNKYLDLAIKGNAEAQYYIGYYYSQGRAVDKDGRKTIYWLQESSNNGYAKAKRALEKLNVK